MHSYYDIGIDIGATAVKAGIVKREGKLVEKAEIRTTEIHGPDHFLSLLETLIQQMLKSSNIEKEAVGGIGVGAPGWVEHNKGIVRDLTNIPNWQDVPLAMQLEQKTGLKSFVDNDANVMAVAELYYGAGREHANFICLTLGTGVGGAIVMAREVFRGAHGLAGEIGHMTLDLEGPECACGARGCLENYVGNRFIVKNAMKRLQKNARDVQGSILLRMAGGDPAKITPKLLAEAAYKGDNIATEVWHETGRYLGTALAVLVNLINPECFIIGGGVAMAGEILFHEMRNTLASLAMNDLGKVTPILEAQLSEDAGIIGAATVAMDCIRKG